MGLEKLAEWLKFMEHGGKYSIHGACGLLQLSSTYLLDHRFFILYFGV